MNPHDVAQVDLIMTGVVLVCACGHRSEAPSKRQADKKHEAHRGIAVARVELEQGLRAPGDQG